jgi:hypothetical protein
MKTHLLEHQLDTNILRQLLFLRAIKNFRKWWLMELRLPAWLKSQKNLIVSSRAKIHRVVPNSSEAFESIKQHWNHQTGHKERNRWWNDTSNKKHQIAHQTSTLTSNSLQVILKMKGKIHKQNWFVNWQKILTIWSILSAKAKTVKNIEDNVLLLNFCTFSFRKLKIKNFNSISFFKSCHFFFFAN